MKMKNGASMKAYEEIFDNCAKIVKEHFHDFLSWISPNKTDSSKSEKESSSLEQNPSVDLSAWNTLSNSNNLETTNENREFEDRTI